MPDPTPLTPAPPVIPPGIKAYVDNLIAAERATIGAEITRGVEAALASRPNNPAPSPITGKDLQLDLTNETPQAKRYAALGLMMQEKYFTRAGQYQLTERPEYQGLKSFLARAKAAGQFLSVFDQGGVFAKETVSSELVELTRPNSILLQAGMRSISGYGARLKMGTIDEGVTVVWVAENEEPAVSTVKTGALILTAHKMMALAKISNDLMRLGNMTAASLIGQDMAAAIGLEIDKTGLKGQGPKRPNGVRFQMDSGQRTPTAGTSNTQKVDDVDGVMESVEKGNIPGGLVNNRGFYYCSTTTYYGLRKARDSAGWLFPELRSGNTLNGYPLFRSESLSGDGILGFGLAAQFIFGEATPLEVAMGESGNDFATDKVTMRGVTEVDFLLRYSKAFAEKTGVAY